MGNPEHSDREVVETELGTRLRLSFLMLACITVHCMPPVYLTMPVQVYASFLEVLVVKGQYYVSSSCTRMRPARHCDNHVNSMH